MMDKKRELSIRTSIMRQRLGHVFTQVRESAEKKSEGFRQIRSALECFEGAFVEFKMTDWLESSDSSQRHTLKLILLNLSTSVPCSEKEYNRFQRGDLSREEMIEEIDKKFKLVIRKLKLATSTEE